MKNILIISSLLWGLNLHFFYSLSSLYPSLYHVIFEALSYYIVTLFLVTLFAFNRHVLFLFTNFLFAVSIFASYFIGMMGIEIDGNMLNNILSTDSSEAFELINYTLVFYLFVAFFTLYVVNTKLLVGKKSLTKKSYFSALALILIMALAFFKIDRNFIDQFSAKNTPKVVPLFLIPSISEYLILRERLVDINKKNISNEFELKEDANATIVVFILGESARGDRFSLNGYEKETNPELKKVENLISFADASSCHTSTLNSIPCLMTRVLQKEYDITIRENSFVRVFKDLGYETYWFSKHSPQKRVDTFCQEAALCEYVKTTPFDEDLLENIAFLKETKKESLVVLHTLGSHIDYNERIPDPFKRYKPLCQGNVSGCPKEELDNSYDNSIVYTDAFIASVIELLKDKNACLVYTSDHGESLGEGEFVQRYGHSTPYAIAPRAQTNVPFMVWFSPKYLEAHKEIDPKKMAAIKDVSHDNIFDTLIGCGGIGYKNEERKSLNLLKR